MSDKTAQQEADRWKQQYYEQLDVLERKQKDWQDLEAILKKAVLKLSIAAEGQHATIDRHLRDIRPLVKQQVDVRRLEQLLDDVSALLLKLGDRQAKAQNDIIGSLVSLLEAIDFPASASKQKNKLLKKLAGATADDGAALTTEVHGFLAGVIQHGPEREHAVSKPGLLGKLLGAGNTTDASAVGDKQIEQVPQAPAADNLPSDDTTRAVAPAQEARTDESSPSVREILVRLLDQLMVPADLHDDVLNLKLRIENETTDASWKRLLKDVAELINALRNRMQAEKQEFESFLQQITARLKEMDGFLAIENASLNAAEQEGDAFDAVVSEQVKDIHNDMSAANDLNDLKTRVEKRLVVVADHIKQYRINEHNRFTSAQKNVEDMQSRLVMLEQESGDLRQLILEKNKEAMLDALTGIPNRLAYEKKADEEIARCHRFDTSLSMAVWDVDHFKNVNDTYGHKVGDRVLKVIAKLLEDRMRETDFIARYGGEEFVMFLPGARETEALELADVLRNKIASSKFYHDDETFRISVSCGISSFVKGDSHEAMFERADKALYAAKHNGRNLCVAASTLNKDA